MNAYRRTKNTIRPSYHLSENQRLLSPRLTIYPPQRAFARQSDVYFSTNSDMGTVRPSRQGATPSTVQNLYNFSYVFVLLKCLFPFSTLFSFIIIATRGNRGKGKWKERYLLDAPSSIATKTAWYDFLYCHFSASCIWSKKSHTVCRLLCSLLLLTFLVDTIDILFFRLLSAEINEFLFFT